MCWHTTRAVERSPSLLRRVKRNLSLRNTSKLITPDKVPPASRELTRRYLAFINFDYIRGNRELKEMERTLTFYFAAPHGGRRPVIRNQSQKIIGGPTQDSADKELNYRINTSQCNACG